MIFQRLSPIGRAGTVLLLLACAGTPISCASRPSRTDQQIQATTAIESPLRTLQARAELEALSPLPVPDESLLRRLVQNDTPALVPGTEAYRKALLSSDDIEIDQPFADAPMPEEINPSRRGQAVKLYTRARVLRQQRQFDDAARVLEQASTLDPASSTIQKALGDIRADQGDALGANNAYERAIELGDRSGTALVHVASQAYTLRNDERVLSLCTLALNAPEMDRDPVARALAGIMLGNAQIRLGYLRAGAESLEQALTDFDPGSRDPRWRQEIVQIIGRQAALWVVVGDAWSTVGAHARSGEAYSRASELAEGAPVSLTARQIVSRLRDGHPASAALVLLDHLRTQASDLGWQEREWVDILTQIPSLQSVLNNAIGELAAQDERPESVRRALQTLEMQGLDSAEALERLGARGTRANDGQTLARILRRIPESRDQQAWARELLVRNPACANGVARALQATRTAPITRLNQITTKAPTDQLLAGSIALHLGRADLLTHLDALELDDREQMDAMSNAWLGVHAQAMASTGRWAQAATLTDLLEQRALLGDRDAKRQLVTALLVSQQPQRANALSEQLTQASAPSVDDLLLAAQVGGLLGAHERVLEHLRRAHEIDPYVTEIIDRLIRLQGAGGPLENEAALRTLVRELGTLRPRSTSFSILRATDLARNGLMREAESTLIELNTHHGTDIIGQDLLLSIWKTQESQGDDQALRNGADWLMERLIDAPNAVQTALSLAQIEFELGEYEQSLDALLAIEQRTGSDAVGRVIEELVRTQMNDPADAQDRVEARLGGRMGIDPTLEYALSLAGRAEVDAAHRSLAILRERIPEQAQLLPTQSRQLSQVVYTLADHADTIAIDDVMLGLIDLIEQRAGALDFFMARTKVLLLSRQAELDIDALLSVIERHAAQMDSDENAQTLRALPVQVLLGEDRPHEAIVIVTRMAIDSERTTTGEDGSMGTDPALVIELFRMLGAVGVNSDLIGVLDALGTGDRMERMIKVTTDRLGTPPRPLEGLEPDQQRADLAYTAGAMASAFERPEQAKAYLRLALSFDPDHAWTNNDLGYMLTEEGTEIDAAEAMLETAVRVEPDEASIVDSLGWLRYKQGLYEDEIDPQTNAVVRAGAISLLTRANQLDRERANATIVEHLGDALWRAGRRDQAIEAWLSGENMLRSRIRVLSAQPEPNRRAIESASAELRGLRYRIQDAEAGGQPKVAPILAELEAQSPDDDPGTN